MFIIYNVQTTYQLIDIYSNYLELIQIHQFVLNNFNSIFYLNLHLIRSFFYIIIFLHHLCMNFIIECCLCELRAAGNIFLIAIIVFI